MTKKRRRSVHLHVMVTPEEQALIADRMAEAGISNMGAYMRKMALNGYVLHVDLSDIREQMKTAAKQAEADRGQSAPKKNAPDRGER